MSSFISSRYSIFEYVGSIVESYIHDDETHKKFYKRYEVITALSFSQGMDAPAYVVSAQHVVCTYFQQYNSQMSSNFEKFQVQRRRYNEQVQSWILAGASRSSCQRILFFCPGDLEREAIKRLPPTCSLTFVDNEMDWLKKQASGLACPVNLQVRDLTRGLWDSILPMLDELQLCQDKRVAKLPLGPYREKAEHVVMGNTLASILDNMKDMAQSFSEEYRDDDDLDLGERADFAVALNITSELINTVGEIYIERMHVITDGFIQTVTDGHPLLEKAITTWAAMNDLRIRAVVKFLHCLKASVKPGGVILFGDTITGKEYVVGREDQPLVTSQKFPVEALSAIPRLFEVIHQATVFWPCAPSNYKGIADRGMGFDVQLFALRNS